ncbi:citrate synthase [Opitutus terrae]|uniref:Citrate synthase n=1 Tax=Opitutus terrae (strain DSM 11246 / JCM 15787 / PB90-1) TaxID=452637 RepID=B1ZNA8_OPITP|nr:citrate synthase [Opitutus terrae]ACB73477.1 citrate synthase I [Opitutus terrae PB90-1]
MPNPPPATLRLKDKEYTLPVIVGTEDECGIDISKLRAEAGAITFDDGFGNTGACASAITFIDGEAGILRYRGYPIEQLAAHSSFVETAYLVINGELPTIEQRRDFGRLLTQNAPLREGLLRFIQNFPRDSHPMAVLSATMNALGAYYPHLASNNHQRDLTHFDEAAAIAISKVRTIAAHTFRVNRGQPFNYPRPNFGYCENFLHLMFSEPYNEYIPTAEVASALNLFLLLHADHEQNCSTSTVRMVASAGANLFASISAGVNALWGPLHGGANMAVIEMLQQIHDSGDDGTKFLESAKAGKGARLMGFGHRVYKHYDPRAKIIKESFYKALASLGIKNDPLLDIAMKLESVALSDDYFVSRKLYPNVDFYSGLIMRAIGIPLNMFTVMFAIGRMPGWIAQWREVAQTPKLKIHRPRQIYVGQTQRDYLPMEQRGRKQA